MKWPTMVFSPWKRQGDYKSHRNQGDREDQGEWASGSVALRKERRRCCYRRRKHVWGKVVIGSLALYDIPLYKLPEGD